MFRASTCCMGKYKLNAFALFMIQTRDHPELKGLPVAQRGKKLAEMYKALPPEHLAKLKAKAEK